MNEFEPISGRQIDRLVDGELSSGERRALLLAIDRESDGWRRLAIAFLEAQALRESFRSCAESADRALIPLSPAAPVTSSSLGSLTSRSGPLPGGALSKRTPQWHLWGPLALCALLAFGLGRMSLPGASRPASSVSSVDPPAQTYVQPIAVPPTESSEDPLLAANASSSPLQQQTLRLELGDDSGGPPQVVDVPVVVAGQIDPEDLLKAPPVIPDSVQRALLRSGRRVYEQRQVYEVTLEDGRRGIVPVSEVLVENAGLDVYQ